MGLLNVSFVNPIIRVFKIVQTVAFGARLTYPLISVGGIRTPTSTTTDPFIVLVKILRHVHELSPIQVSHSCDHGLDTLNTRTLLAVLG